MNDIDKKLKELKDVRYRQLVMNCKSLSNQILNCLNDDFINFHKSDIKNWLEDLNEIQKDSDDLNFT